jgi:hypothetical protein
MAENGRQKGDAALVLALAAGQTARDAARSAGVGERTATRRLADPAFRRRVEALRADLVRQAAGRLVEGMTQAADTLRSLLEARSEAVRLGAARTILELAPRLREAAELEERLRALEERLGQTAEEYSP